MNAKRDTDERAELSSLLPAPARPELTADRQQLLRGHLMNEITEAPRPAPRRTRRLGWLALPALAGGLALAVVLADGGPGAPAAPPTAQGAPLNVAPVAVALVLDHAAQVAESKPAGAVTGGQFTYVKSLVAFSSMNAAAGAEPDVTHGVPHQRELWLSVDGKQWGVLIEEGRKPFQADPRDGKGKARPGEPAPRADGGSWLEPNPKPGLNGPTYEYLAALPTDPDTLLRKVYKETKGQGQTPDQEAFVTIGDLLREQVAPPAVSAALYRAAAKIPGVSVVDDAVDASGRHGVAVALVHGGTRTEWIFDRSSYEFLGEREVVVDTGNSWGAPGTVVGQSAVLGRGVVDAAGERPKQ
ncbi:CU044_5270 family protein [Kitasatospora sp. NBC_00240]|uniref:CU044_5270 family protein n=1 Tax=Kitasatospora sp. NBC_00240 TaxID=2903567 RepID=UPI00225B01B8|nr:CU044_5270 family protein [Kitasatospora sp. NBC_00240]MCX5212642.1 CU044_5270 family protein [Kitasatospora sp. NBC_00240]